LACLFLQRLSHEIHVLLSEVDHKDPKAMATQADHHWGLYESPAAAVIPMMSDPAGIKDGINAVRQERGGRGGRGCRVRGSGGAGAARQPVESDASMAAWLASGCASNIGASATRPTPAPHHVPGRETRRPGATISGCPWGAVVRHGHYLLDEIFGGQRSLVLGSPFL
jgi:hypothetical protein